MNINIFGVSKSAWTSLYKTHGSHSSDFWLKPIYALLNFEKEI